MSEARENEEEIQFLRTVRQFSVVFGLLDVFRVNLYDGFHPNDCSAHAGWLTLPCDAAVFIK